MLQKSTVKKGFEERNLEHKLEKFGIFDLNIHSIETDPDYDYCVVYDYEGNEIFKVTLELYDKLGLK